TNREVADWYDVPFQWNVEKVRLPPDIDPHSQSGNKYTPTWSTDDNRIDIPEAIRAWRAYKGDNELVGFADMLERVVERSLVPYVDYLIIDEFQDITQLQFRVYEEWKQHMESVIIAGDDDQVVYAWQGADPALLLSEGGEDVILDTSHRLPSRILRVTQHAIRHIEERQEKNLKPRIDGGIVEARKRPSTYDLVTDVTKTVEEDDGSIMVLFRARYQLFEFLDDFVDTGIPFRIMTDQRMWTDRLSDYVDAVQRYDADEPLTGLQVRRLAEMLADSAFGMNERDELFDTIDELQEEAGVEDLEDFTIDPATVQEHVPFMPGPASAADMVRKVTRYQERSLRAYLAGEYRDVPRDRVRVGTIHSAKGREADHVYVSTDLTEKVVEQMAASADPEDIPEGEELSTAADKVPVLTDNERRVFYVGMSRARERLVLLEDFISGAPTLPIDVILFNEPRDGEIEDLLEMVADPPAA
ncbi:MAG: ATP-dependent helicase, partial [Halobacteriales archaeon]|nr:ATP-dependent helicase [Halobacteriales archaeon]